MDQSIFFTTVLRRQPCRPTLCKVHSGSKEMLRALWGPRWLRPLGAPGHCPTWRAHWSFWHCHGPDCSRVCLACLGLCVQAPQLGIAQSHLQMLCTGVHKQPAGEMLAESGGFCRRSAPRARGRGSSHVPVWPGAPPPSPHITALSTAKAVYKSNRGCHHVPRRRHTNLIVAAATCREGGI